MSTVVEEITNPPETVRREATGTGNTFGKCPVCKKALCPRDRVTGEPKAPALSGVDGRAKCGGCGTILQYIGNYEWRVAVPTDYSEEDLEANRLGLW